MRVGVIGSGAVGQALSRGFTSRGHEVMIGSRSPEKLADFEEAKAGTNDEVAAFGELLALATSWDGTESAIDLAGRENFAGKVLMDVTNPLAFGDGQGPPTLALGHTDSGGEQVQRWLPEARVVKAFNIVGNTLMVDPDLPGGPPDMLIAGEDEEAKGQVTKIAEDWGWPVIDLGGIEASRLLEPFAMVWILSAFRLGGRWEQAFKLLHS